VCCPRVWGTGRIDTTGTQEFHRHRAALAQSVGGGMRQAGILAAAGLYALEHHRRAVGGGSRQMAAHLARAQRNRAEGQPPDQSRVRGDSRAAGEALGGASREARHHCIDRTAPVWPLTSMRLTKIDSALRAVPEFPGWPDGDADAPAEDPPT